SVRQVSGSQEASMKGSICSAAMAAALLLTAWTSHARADEETGASETQPPPANPPVVVSPARDIITVQEKIPNAGLISHGAILFGIPYVSSVVVAASSDRVGDKNLYIPLVGPWMDLANRGSCVGPRCERETSNQVLLVANGILQSVGALQILAGFVLPSTRI